MKSSYHFTTKKFVEILFSCISIISILTLSGCSGENHLHQAIKHSKASIIAGDGATIALQSTYAIIHALSIPDQEYVSSAGRIHLALAIVSLEQAIENGNYEEDDLARDAARMAVAHFKEVRK
ncbi:small metal-binding protein SmbP [Nitrosomonas ureae]|uniref:Small metal-binding protein n=1 Tax=Nitrosomonas ureae TaxID=44577 RepID=A0A1H9HLZ0_9PROT|nr:small metal-binding protein SmbP [Nitrosomonas ureae]SEQ63335.1 Small metal-binding protein [Nitrosomonas ureae]